MKTLSLIRHAKTLQPVPGQRDQDRRLTERGRQASTWIGRSTRTHIPDLILCSTAVRTRETVARIAEEWDKMPTVTYESALYMAGGPTLRTCIMELPDRAEAAWIVGHNPDLHELALRLAGRAGNDSGLADRFATGTRAVFESAAEHWSDFFTADRRLAAVIVPPKADWI